MNKIYKYLSFVLLLLLILSLVNIKNKVKAKKPRTLGYTKQYDNALQLIKEQSTTLFYIDKGYDAYQYFLLHYSLAPNKFIISQENLTSNTQYDYVLIKDHHKIKNHFSFIGDTIFKKKKTHFDIYLIKIKQN